jgi:hypothetical protein
MYLRDISTQWHSIAAAITSSLIALKAILRGLPLFAAKRPKTPLRVLCIMAFDTLAMLRGKPLTLRQRRVLAALLDFGACANAAFDNKERCRREARETLQLLEAAGMRSSVAEYLHRLRDLECSRPLTGGDAGQFREVVRYREAVVRLSLAKVAATAHGRQCLARQCLGRQCLDDAIRATHCDDGLKVLFRIAMQCQIIDDVLDYSKDLSAGLPSFLTACRSLPQAFELTRLAALGYADARDLPRTGGVLPLRIALFLVSTCTILVIGFAQWSTARRKAHVELATGSRNSNFR